MELKRLHEDFPIFYCENFKILTDAELEIIKNHIVNFKGDTGYGKVFPVPPDNLGILNELYREFTSCVTDQFGGSINHELNRQAYWIYYSNRLDPDYLWHNHVDTSTILCVYYINIPPGSGGEIDFELNGNFFSFKPKPFDFIIIPNYLNHAPRQPLSNEYRISLNMEAQCLESPGELIDNFDNKKE
jgi:hypothetical protein